MITYQDICEKYNTFRNDAFDNKMDLARTISLLRSYIEDDLLLTNKTWKDTNGKEYMYVSIVDTSNLNNVEEKLAQGLSYNYIGKNVSCDFGIQLTLEKSPNSFPKSNVYTNFTGKHDDGKVILEMKVDNKLLPFEIINDDDFGPICEKFKSIIFNSFE